MDQNKLTITEGILHFNNMFVFFTEDENNKVLMRILENTTWKTLHSFTGTTIECLSELLRFTQSEEYKNV